MTRTIMQRLTSSEFCSRSRPNLNCSFHSTFVAALTKINLEFTIEDEFTNLLLDTDESYSLTLTGDEEPDELRVVISSLTYYGTRHALETLAQLISFNQREGLFQVGAKHPRIKAKSSVHRP